MIEKKTPTKMNDEIKEMENKYIKNTHDTNTRVNEQNKERWTTTTNQKKKNLDIQIYVYNIVFDVYKNEYREENKEIKKIMCERKIYV